MRYITILRMFASAGLNLLVRAVLMVSGALVMAFLTDWQLALIGVVMLLVAGVIIRQILVSVQPFYSVVQQKLSALNTIVQENLAGVQVVKAFVREPYTVEQFEQANSDYRRENVRVGRLLARLHTTRTVTVPQVADIEPQGSPEAVGQ